MKQIIQSITSPSYEPYANIDKSILLVAILTVATVLAVFAAVKYAEKKNQRSINNF